LRLARPKPPGRLLDPAGNRGARGMIAAVAAKAAANRIRLIDPLLRSLRAERGPSSRPAHAKRASCDMLPCRPS